MAQQYDVTMPQDLDIAGNWTLRVTAVDPATGNPVAGVTIGEVAITADALGAGTLASGTFKPVLLRTQAPSG